MSLITRVSCRSAVELKCLNVNGIFKPSNPPVDTRVHNPSWSFYSLFFCIIGCHWGLRVPADDAGAHPRVGGCSWPQGLFTCRWDSAPYCSVCPVTAMTERSHHCPRSFPESQTLRKTPAVEWRGHRGSQKMGPNDPPVIVISTREFRAVMSRQL